jgi:type IV secretory pathway TraG/TraD family ATPase VirD4
MLGQYDDMKAMVSYISDDRSPQTQGVMSELQQLSREIFLGNFKKHGSLSMRNLVRSKGGKFVFIEYDIGIGAMLSPIYSLLFDMAIKEALCRKKSEGNVYFIVDEFKLIPNLQHIDDAVNFGRSLGVKFMIGIQNVEQVYECYGEQRARSIMSGFLTSVTFRVNDASSKKYIKDLHGENRKKEIYMSSVQTRGITENIREAYVVEDWDISNLGLGEAIIGLPGKPPFRFKFAKARK